MTKDAKKAARPPVIAVFGHIDHGKSTLLDYIRKANTTAKEVGGITQKMSAYKVERTDAEGNVRSMTFLDTPGHESFVKLRSRGASVADIAILVVAADEGVKPQTVEALNTIRQAKLPFIVAMNKIDKPNADLNRLKQSLAENDILVEGYGGDVPAVAVSATTGKGMDELLDLLLLLSEMIELTADIHAPFKGVVLESMSDKTSGVGAIIIVKEGTLKAGDFIVCEDVFSPTRIMKDFAGKNISQGLPSDPIFVVGFNRPPQAGTEARSVKTKKLAEESVAAFTASAKKHRSAIEIGNPQSSVVIPLVIKASTTDVIEAIIHELRKIKNEKVLLKIIAADVGNITEGDIKTASAMPEGIVLGFSTKIEASAKILSERLSVPVEIFSIIYKLSEWLQEFVTKKTPKTRQEVIRGEAKILKFFSKTKDRQVVGGRVESGLVSVGDEVRIIRRESEIGKGKVKELQQSRTPAKEVSSGVEFGAMIESKMEIAPGDKVQSIVMEIS